MTERKSEFKQLLSNGEQEFDENKPLRKIKVKALKGSPFVISLEPNDVVGEGSYGKVVRVFDLDNRDEELVAKVIPLDDKQRLAAMKSELRVLVRLPLHPNLVNYKKIRVSSLHKQYFIMEYCNGGTLTNILDGSRRINEADIIDFLGQFCRGYRVLYKNGIIHRDLKPENILLNDGVYKIADFGLAKIVDSLQIQSISAKGTPLYIAPELVRREKASSKVDMWSLGVILYRMLFRGTFPFLIAKVDYDVQTALRHIQEKPLVIPSLPVRSESLITLVRRMLEKNESKRISWEELFENELIIGHLQSEGKIPPIEQDNKNKIKRSTTQPILLLDKTEEVQQINMADSLEYFEMIKVPEKNGTPQSNKSSQASKSVGFFSGKKPKQLQFDDQESKENPKTTTTSTSTTSTAATTNTNTTSNKSCKRTILEEELQKSEEVIHKLLQSTEFMTKQDEEILAIREKSLFMDRIVLRLTVMGRLLFNCPQTKSHLLQFAPMSERAVILILSAAQLINSHLLNENQVILSTQAMKVAAFLASHSSIDVLHATPPIHFLLYQDREWLTKFINEYVGEKGSPQLDKNRYYKRVSSLDLSEIARELEFIIKGLSTLFFELYNLAPSLQRGLLVLFVYLHQVNDLCNQGFQVSRQYPTCQTFWNYYEDVEHKRSKESLLRELKSKINIEQ